jgi:hypothetical protein
MVSPRLTVVPQMARTSSEVGTGVAERLGWAEDIGISRTLGFWFVSLRP